MHVLKQFATLQNLQSEAPVKDRVKLTERDLRLLGIFRVLVEAGGLTAAETMLGMERSNDQPPSASP
jgi:hypothetical protein